MIDMTSESNANEELKLEISKLKTCINELKEISDKYTFTKIELEKISKNIDIIKKSKQVLFKSSDQIDETALLNDICRIIVKTGDYRFVWIGLAGQDINETIKPVAYFGNNAAYFNNLKNNWNYNEYLQGPFGKALRTCTPYILHNVTEDPDFIEWKAEAIDQGYYSFASFPLIYIDDIIGILSIYSPRANDFSLSIIELLKELANDLTYGLISRRVHNERNRAEEERMKLSNNIRLLLESTDEGIYGIDLNGRCTLINKSALKMLKYSLEEIIGKKMHELIHHSYPDSKPYPMEECPIYKSLKMGEGIRRDDEILWRKDGTSFPVEYSSYPIFDKNTITGAVITFNDISARKKLEWERERLIYQIRKRSIMREAILSSLGEGLIETDPKGNIVYINDSALRLNGFATINEAKVTLTGHNPDFLLTYLDGRNVPLEEWPPSRCLRGERFFNLELHVQRKKENIDYIGSFNGNPIYDDTGKILAGIITLRDITEQKYSEKALKESEDKFRTVFNSVYDAIFIHELDGRIIDVNDKMLKLYRVNKEEALKLSIIKDYSSPDNPENMMELWKKAISGEDQLFEWKARRPADGSTFDVEVYLHKVQLNDKEVILATVRDLTERKKAIQALEESEKRFRAIFEQASVGIAQLGIDGHYIRVNQKLCSITGYSYDELIKLRFMDITYPEDVNKDLMFIQKLINGDIDTFTRNKRYIRKDGSLIWVRLTISLVRGIDNAPEYMISILEDISMRKKAEEELQDAKNQVELYMDLMSHDINNMNMIGMGYLEVALKSLKLNEEQKNLLIKTYDALKNSTALINNVRNIQKARTAKLRNTIIDIGAVLLDITNQYSNIPDRDITINYKPEKGLFVMANELIKDIFSNLVSNAIKHSNGPLIININVLKVQDNGQDFYQVVVEDTGPGIPDHIKTRLFTKLQRGMTDAKGTGLGLYLVRVLVENYHGKVWVEDRIPGNYKAGSKFIIMLPVAQLLTS